MCTRQQAQITLIAEDLNKNLIIVVCRLINRTIVNDYYISFFRITFYYNHRCQPILILRSNKSLKKNRTI